MKRVLILIVVAALALSLCACGSPDTHTSVTTGDIHIERHYQDNGDLFCIIETNIETGTVVTTYFYWQHNDRGTRTLASVECITVDGTGAVVAHVSSPGHS